MPVGVSGCLGLPPPPSLLHHPTPPQAVSALWGPTGLRGAAKAVGLLALRGLRALPQGKGSHQGRSAVMNSRDLPSSVAPRDLQAILSSEIDWNAPELQTLSPSARDFLERLLQVGEGVWDQLTRLVGASWGWVVGSVLEGGRAAETLLPLTCTLLSLL